MITGVEVKNPRGSLLDLPLDNETSGFFVESIEGLEPVKATLVSSGFAQLDGAQYQSSRRETREIKIRLGLEPDYETESVEQLRDRLYDFFMPKSQVDLSFRKSDSLATKLGIVGRVETFDAPLFVKEPTATIQIKCFDPDFINPVPVVISGTTVSTMVETSHIYDGTVETGLTFRITPNRYLDAFTIYHRGPDGLLNTMDITKPLNSGEVLTIGTSKGDNHVTRTVANTPSSYLYALTPQSPWVELQPGDNRFRIFANGAAIPYAIEYTRKYGGL